MVFQMLYEWAIMLAYFSLHSPGQLYAALGLVFVVKFVLAEGSYAFFHGHMSEQYEFGTRVGAVGFSAINCLLLLSCMIERVGQIAPHEDYGIVMFLGGISILCFLFTIIFARMCVETWRKKKPSH